MLSALVETPPLPLAGRPAPPESRPAKAKDKVTNEKEAATSDDKTIPVLIAPPARGPSTALQPAIPQVMANLATPPALSAPRLMTVPKLPVQDGLPREESPGESGRSIDRSFDQGDGHPAPAGTNSQKTTNSTSVPVAFTLRLTAKSPGNLLRPESLEIPPVREATGTRATSDPVPSAAMSMPSTFGMNLKADSTAAAAGQTSFARTVRSDGAPPRAESPEISAASPARQFDSGSTPHTRLVPETNNPSPSREQAIDTANPRAEISAPSGAISEKIPSVVPADGRALPPSDIPAPVPQSLEVNAEPGMQLSDNRAPSAPASISRPAADELESAGAEAIHPMHERHGNSSANRSGPLNSGGPIDGRDEPARTGQTPSAGQSKALLTAGRVAEPPPNHQSASSSAHESDHEADPNVSDHPATDHRTPELPAIVKDAPGVRIGEPVEAMRQLGGSISQPVEASGIRGVANDPEEAAPVLPREISPEPAVERAARPAIASQISLKVAAGDTASVDVQVRERAGRIDVAVRTGDSELSKSLQSGLGDLMTRLENRGYKAEAWAPTGVRPAVSNQSASEGAASQHPPGHSGSGSGQQRHQQGDSNPRRQPAKTTRFEEAFTEENAKDGINQ